MFPVFQNKIIIITGGASGIGKALAQQLSADKATIIIADLQLAQAQEVAANLQTQYGNIVEAHRVDVTNNDAVHALIKDIAERHQRIDYLFNNAGIGIVGEMQHVSLEQWHRVININLMGVVHGCMAVYPIMIQQKQGHIINTASVAGLIGFPTAVPYAASKHAVVGLTRSLRAEGRDFGIRVSGICPGFVESSLLNTSLTATKDNKQLVRQTPFKRITAEQAAIIILKGIVKNREMITFPFYSQVIAWLTVLFPSSLKWLYQKNIRAFRKNNS